VGVGAGYMDGLRGKRLKVFLRREVVEGLLAAARSLHPREALLLLRGRLREGSIYVEELLIPPFAIHGLGFSSFNPYLLPIDPSIIGVAHSHPSGSPRPSVEDLNARRGYVMVIVSHPYASTRDIHVFSPRGDELEFNVV